MAAASSPPTQDPPVLPVPPPPSSSSRRLPPPCWSHDETVALIDAYREKWYSLRRGNLRANHWQEVADAVAARCPLSSGNPSKTSVQCRHKMEKLRKRYRSELQRALAAPNHHRFSSSWVHFKRMDSMEKGPSSAVPVNSVPMDHVADDDGEDEDGFQDLYENDVENGVAYNRNYYGSMSNGIGSGSGSGKGFRIRIPGRSTLAPAGTKIYRNIDENPNPNFGSTRVSRDGNSGRLGLGKSGGGVGVGKKRKEKPVTEMVSAIKVLGDGFVKMERMKIEMAREVEAMRMEMELKRTEMILESQQRIVEAFAKAFSISDKKRKQREF
uniref:Putative trihelix transcription factor ASIL2 n=1 Tax=Davidia involucrata TaxID=16924 RepID=A0A5B6YH34_DAVIN